MSLAGLKKQFNKANQFVSEKIGGAKGTELDEDYLTMEKKVDAVDKLVSDVMTHTQEYLQPNPASRAKLMTQSAWSKVRGQAFNATYPQPEGTLGDTLTKHGSDLGDDSEYGQACVSVGDAFKQLAEAKYSLEGRVKQNFLEPLLQLQANDLKEIAHHRKKLEGRRLDYDCKRRKGKGTPQDDAELKTAEEKFCESKELTERAMHNLLSNDAEQLSQLNGFVEAVLDYHREAVDILEQVYSSICDRAVQLASKPRLDHVPKRVAATTAYGDRDSMCSDDSSGVGGSVGTTGFEQIGGGKTGSYSFASAPVAAASASNFSKPPAAAPPPPPSAVSSRPCAKALYDFEPENEGELGFKEGDVIELTSQIDENWFEGKVRGQAGFFPVNYVKVVVPL